ncbi:DUF2586 domain-containing protein [Pseudotamlana carrageenivorans]|uniref:DUF2586 domain-containing protein n=1 Tax=Pseudotamlana carrageenivorans TaxID=2069432 RepID=A0A2I7SF18_9FLAO|nr:DUF2586 domain-containing protein [Tamlana carrageenivorans]AUS04488.1 hypothetical protein C1A40_02925 [Tamlana carrageenivorans]
MLPGIDIKFSNGNIGTVVPSADGVFGLLASAVAVATKFELNTPYVLKGMTDVASLGIVNDTDNYVLYQWLSEFFAEAGEGTELWLMGFPKTDKVSDWFTQDVGTGITPVEGLLDAANGKLTALFTAFSPDGSYVPTVSNGFDDDIADAKSKAQTLADNYTATKYAPFYTILEAYAFNGTHTDLPDLLTESNDRVGVFIGATQKRTGTVTTMGATTSVLAGRLASTQVQESPGKVKNGPLANLTAFIVDKAVEAYDVESLHDKGYISFRTHVGKAGYYITDGRLATKADDDYHYIERRRTIDKAFRIAHDIASNEILNDFDLTNEGKVDPIYAKDVSGRMETAIATQMTARGELSTDSSNPNDLGVQAAFNLDANVASTNKIEIVLKVRPKAYARWIEIVLGYDVNLNS